MGKIVSVKSKLWNSIYYKLRDHFLEGDLAPATDKANYLEVCFANMGIILHHDRTGESRWSHVEFTDNVDVTELVLRWA